MHRVYHIYSLAAAMTIACHRNDPISIFSALADTVANANMVASLRGESLLARPGGVTISPKGTFN